MNDAFRVLGVLSLLTAALPGVVTLAGCENNESSGLRRDAGMGDSGAAGATGVNADGAADQSSGGARADGAAPDLRGMDGASGGATGTGSADAAGVGGVGGMSGGDARPADVRGSTDAGSGDKDAAGGADAGGTGTGGTGGSGTGGADGGGTGGTGGGTGSSSGPSCPSGLPGGADATFCVGRSLYEGISTCHDGGCTCVAGRHVDCLNECVKNAADPGGTCRGGFLVCPMQGSNQRQSICFLGAVYSVTVACAVNAGCNCRISQSETCTGACVELSDGTAECQ